MKQLITFVLFLTSINVFGDDSFQERKSKWSAHLSDKITELQNTKSCVDGATDNDSLKKCRKDRKESLKEVRKERKERFKNKKKPKGQTRKTDKTE